ncbi:MAG: Dipeptidylaminopeptidase/acylaminoacyl-peptidase, partial [uncultured bacterium]
ALGANPEIPAVVIWAGAVYTYSDFSEYSIEDNSYQPPPADSLARKKRNEMFEKYGTFDPNSNFWKQVPMTNYLSDIKGAISLNHAVDDPVVDIRYSRNLNSLLDKTSISHELNEYSSGGHNIAGSNFNLAMENAVEFFRKYLNVEK